MTPGIGQEIIIKLLTNHKKEWETELEEVRQDIIKRKTTLLKHLPQKFSYLKNTYGMFGILNLNKKQIQTLKTKFAIYLPDTGRINFAGLKIKKIKHIGEAITQVSKLV